MKYTSILTFRRSGNTVTPVRVSMAHGYRVEKRIPWANLYRGHCDWIAADIEHRNRISNGNLKEHNGRPGATRRAA